MAEDGLIHPDDGQMISEKIVEMCDRVKRMDKFVPGTVATLALELDDEVFEISVVLRKKD